MLQLKSRRSRRRPLHRGMLPSVFWLALFLPTAGCIDSSRRAGPTASSRGSAQKKVMAQGQILPADGFIQLAAPPGDVVEEVLVAVGSQVTANQPLVKMRSEAVRAAQRRTLIHRIGEAEKERAIAIDRAQRQVALAKLKLDQLEAQTRALERKAGLLKFARQQVEAAEKVLRQLESISGDNLTNEFVGQIEIDRQRVAVGEATLSYKQQEENQRQAADDLRWAQKAAQQEITAAEVMLKSATESEALKTLQLELATLDRQTEAAQIISPDEGVIVAINATKGEASVRLPLIEMANNNRLVCEVEINEMDAAHVQEGQPATIRSRAFGSTSLSGHVLRKYQLVGRPQLRPLDPLARVDYRAVTAVVELTPDSTERAKNWLQLQVEVEIDTRRSENRSTQPSSQLESN